MAQDQKTTATVAIGMPVYNGAKHLRTVLDALLVQTFADFQLTISDNASTDDTENICRQYASRDSRVVYIRQPENIGPSDNFRFVFLAAKSEYFMWNAADDLRSPDFLAVNLAFLATHPDYASSTSPVRFTNGEFDAVKMGDESLDDDDPYERMIKPFSTWHANGRYYSLYRRAAIKGWPHLENNAKFLGSDWTLITHVVRQGKHHRAAEGWVELGTDGISGATDLFALHRKRKIHWIAPFHTVIVDCMTHMRGATVRQKLLMLWRILRLNHRATRYQLRNWRRARRKLKTQPH